LLCREGAQEGQSQEEGGSSEEEEALNVPSPLFSGLKYFNIVCTCLFIKLQATLC